MNRRKFPVYGVVTALFGLAGLAFWAWSRPSYPPADAALLKLLAGEGVHFSKGALVINDETETRDGGYRQVCLFTEAPPRIEGAEHGDKDLILLDFVSQSCGTNLEATGVMWGDRRDASGRVTSFSGVTTTNGHYLVVEIFRP